MTVVVGFVGPDGGVMASDSEATETDYTKFDVAKLWTSGGCLFGYSGNTAIKDPLALAIDAALVKAGPGLSRWNIKQLLCEAANNVIRPEYENYLPRLAAGTVPKELAGKLLVIGKDDEGYWLLELNEHITGTFENRGFHAIGSGSVAAQVANGLLVKYESHGRSLWHLNLIAYRTVKTCINVLGGPYGVGGPVQLWKSDEVGGFVQLDKGAIERVAESVEAWMTIERESLDKISGEPDVGGDKQPTTEDIPQPLE
jgi:20S proteasome alpha/beta subunit